MALFVPSQAARGRFVVSAGKEGTPRLSRGASIVPSQAWIHVDAARGGGVPRLVPIAPWPFSPILLSAGGLCGSHVHLGRPGGTQGPSFVSGLCGSRRGRGGAASCDGYNALVRRPLAIRWIVGGVPLTYALTCFADTPVPGSTCHPVGVI